MDYLRDFDQYQRRRNLRPATMTARRRVLRAFTRSLEGRDLLGATPDDVETWLDSLPGRDGDGVGAKARATYLSHLSAFFTWALHTGLVGLNPVDRVAKPRLQQGLPRPISEQDLGVALQEADSHELRLMLILAGVAGLRVGEIAHVHRSDFIEAQDPPLLVVRAGKGGKQRVVPVHPDVLTAVRLVEGDTDRIFWRPRGTPATNQWISTTINDHLRAVGIDATAHQLRHRAATVTYRATKDLRATQHFLGHSSSAATDVYAAFAPDALVTALGPLTTIFGSDPG